MGKTAVVTALVLANPSTARPCEKDWKARTTDGATRTKYKMTIVICNNTLVQQWEDEVKKFAPKLNIQTFYASGTSNAAAKKKQAMASLRDCDVLITTPHMATQQPWSTILKNVHAHRLVVDEAHLINSNEVSMPITHLIKYSASNVWMVTGTPFSTSLDQLQPQAFLTGHLAGGVQLLELLQDEDESPAIRDALRKVMIRHTKSQRVGDQAALALPETATQTFWLDMTADERLLFQLCACADGEPQWLSQVETATQHINAGPIREGMQARLEALAHIYGTGKYAQDAFAGLKTWKHYVNERYDADDQASSDTLFRIDAPCLDEPLEAWNDDQPLSFGAASAAFKRMHTETDVVEEYKEKVLDRNTYRYSMVPRARIAKAYELDMSKVTKYRHLLAELLKLRQAEPDMRVAIFTHHETTQAQLVKWLGSAEVADLVANQGANTSGEANNTGMSGADDADNADGAGGIDGADGVDGVVGSVGAVGVDVAGGAYGVGSPDGADDAGSAGGARCSGSPIDVNGDNAPARPRRQARAPRRADDDDESLAAREGKARAPRKAAKIAPRGASSPKPWAIAEFTQKTTPTTRHKIIQQFQSSDDKGAKLFIATFKVAAVGITLTAANRVFLLEPTLDPAMALQAAGRIHRMGQTKEVHIKQYAYKDSLDEAILALHAAVGKGEMTMRDGAYPPEAIELFRQHKVGMPHVGDPATERDWKCSLDYTDSHGFYAKKQMCMHCGVWFKIPGSAVWWADQYSSQWKWLDGLKGDIMPKKPVKPPVDTKHAVDTGAAGGLAGAGSSSDVKPVVIELDDD